MLTPSAEVLAVLFVVLFMVMLAALLVVLLMVSTYITASLVVCGESMEKTGGEGAEVGTSEMDEAPAFPQRLCINCDSLGEAAGGYFGGVWC